MKNNDLIETNSFYDVYQRVYTVEERKLLQDLVGMPIIDSYEELMDGLGVSKEEKTKSARLVKTDKNRK